MLLDGDGVRAWLGAFASAFREQRAELDDLDRRSGDGDFGTNLGAAIDRADVELATAAGAGEALGALATACMAAGGTSGPLFGVWFRAFARAASAGELDVAALAAAAGAGLEAVSRLGGAQPGDCTMVDAMAPATEALGAAVERSAGLGEALRSAAFAAREGADATADLIARRGRASYVGELARGVVDPGAVAVALFFEAAGGLEGGELGGIDHA